MVVVCKNCKLWFLLCNIAGIRTWQNLMICLSKLRQFPLPPHSVFCHMSCGLLVYTIYQSIFRVRGERWGSDTLIFSWLEALTVFGAERGALKQVTASGIQALRLDMDITFLFRQRLMRISMGYQSCFPPYLTNDHPSSLWDWLRVKNVIQM